MSYLDPRFRYHGHATHADPTAFARRMRERQRVADAVRAREAANEQERSRKVRPIAQRSRKAAP